MNIHTQQWGKAGFKYLSTPPPLILEVSEYRMQSARERKPSGRTNLDANLDSTINMSPAQTYRPDPPASTGRSTGKQSRTSARSSYESIINDPDPQRGKARRDDLAAMDWNDGHQASSYLVRPNLWEMSWHEPSRHQIVCGKADRNKMKWNGVEYRYHQNTWGDMKCNGM